MYLCYLLETLACIFKYACCYGYVALFYDGTVVHFIVFLNNFFYSLNLNYPLLTSVYRVTVFHYVLAFRWTLAAESQSTLNFDREVLDHLPNRFQDSRRLKRGR